MINFTDITGLASSSIAITAMVLQLPSVARLQKTHLALFISTLVIIVLIPFHGLPLAAYLRGGIGDLSITSLVLLTLTILRSLSDCTLVDIRPNNLILILIALAALGLYPMALGLSYFDPYRLGYGNVGFVGGLLLLTLVANYYQQTLLALTLTLAVLAWNIGWYESTNLWDYLLDPLLAIYAIGALLTHWCNSKHSAYPTN